MNGLNYKIISVFLVKCLHFFGFFSLQTKRENQNRLLWSGKKQENSLFDKGKIRQVSRCKMRDDR